MYRLVVLLLSYFFMLWAVTVAGSHSMCYSTTRRDNSVSLALPSSPPLLRYVTNFGVKKKKKVSQDEKGSDKTIMSIIVNKKRN